MSPYQGRYDGLDTAQPLLASTLENSISASVWEGYMPTERYQLELTLDMDIRTLLTLASSFIISNGRIAKDNEVGSSDFPVVAGFIGSGFLNKKSTLLCVEVIDSSDEKCTLSITAAAKEGRLNQSAARKAVKKFIRSL